MLIFDDGGGRGGQPKSDFPWLGVEGGFSHEVIFDDQGGRSSGVSLKVISDDQVQTPPKKSMTSLMNSPLLPAQYMSI